MENFEEGYKPKHKDLARLFKINSEEDGGIKLCEQASIRITVQDKRVRINFGKFTF